MFKVQGKAIGVSREATGNSQTGKRRFNGRVRGRDRVSESRRDFDFGFQP
jgi:hypothetical protein